MTHHAPSITEYQGRYFRTCGKGFNSVGKLAPKKFSLGSDKTTAEYNAKRLVQLWAEVERSWQQDKQSQKIDDESYAGIFNRITGEYLEGAKLGESPAWTDESLAIAEAVRKGKHALKIEPVKGETPTQYHQRIADLRADYSVIEFTFDPEHYAKGQQAISANVEWLDSQAAELSALADVPVPSQSMQSLHHALNAYATWAESKYQQQGKVTAHGRKVVEAARRFITYYDDRPLAKLTYNAIEEMTGYWEKRPLARKANGKPSKKPISVETVKNMVKHLRRFLNWLHRSDQYQWKDTDRIIDDATKLRPSSSLMTEEEKKQKSKGPDTWDLDELVMLYTHATDWERLFMLLGLNASLAQSECLHLNKNEVDLNSNPPCIVFTRNKTGRRGGVNLWPETVMAMKWSQRQRKSVEPKGNKRAILSQKGTELTTQRIANIWNNLLDRVQKEDKGFRRLPFKYLRKTSSQLFQDVGGADSEVIAILQARAKVSQHDDQADRYYRRNLTRVYEASNRVHEYLKPMFESAPDAFSADQSKSSNRANPNMHERIRQRYDECGNISLVARDLGVSRSTVNRALKVSVT